MKEAEELRDLILDTAVEKLYEMRSVTEDEELEIRASVEDSEKVLSMIAEINSQNRK